MESLPWSRGDVMALIDIWSDDAIQSQLEGMKRNKRVFERISQELSARGITRSYVQCRNKVKALKKEYKKMKDNNNRSGQKRISCRYAKELEAILGGKPSTRPRQLIDTSQELADSDDGDEAAPDNTSILSEHSDHEDQPENVSKGDEREPEPENIPVPDQDVENDVSTPRRQPVHRRPKSSKQKSIGEAIALMTEAQVKSDEMFVKLEEERMKREMDFEERREKVRMEFEERRMRTS